MRSTEATLTVRTEEAVVHLAVAPGQSVREALDATHLRVRAACGGNGSCGACVVRLVSGAANPPTVADHRRLTAAERAEGQRLACQLRLAGDAEIWLAAPAPPSPWRSIPAEELAPVAGAQPALRGPALGVAVDLGTTHLRVALWDRRAGRRLAARQGTNPQATFGADVLNRLGAAGASPARARELSTLPRSAILDAVRDMLARDLGEEASGLAEVGRVAVVGNTAMLALLSGQGGPALLAPESWQRPVDCRPEDPAAWRAEWGLPHAELLLSPPIGGFVGSDLAAGLLATGLTATPAPALLLDLGTNTEIALWDGRVLRVTSVPGGPAFEGGTRRGMPAGPGAIFRVARAGDGTLDCRVVGGGEPRGFCGSGLVDAIALLLAAGQLRPSGRFAVPPGGEGLSLRAGDVRTALSGSDVDAFQRAKAATAAAAAVLLAEAGLGWRDLSRLWVCGAFGQTLDVGHAQALGLLPALPPDRIGLFGGAALAGCERALLAEDAAGLLAGAASGALAVNMSLVERYDDLFIRHLRLGPVSGG